MVQVEESPLDEYLLANSLEVIIPNWSLTSPVDRMAGSLAFVTFTVTVLVTGFAIVN